MTLRYRNDQSARRAAADRLSVGPSPLHVGQPQAADIGVPRRVAEAGRISETVLGVRSTCMPSCCHENGPWFGRDSHTSADL